VRFFGDIGAMDRVLTLRVESSPVTNQYGETTSVTNTDTVVNAAYSFASKDERNELNKETQFEKLFFVIRYNSTVTLRAKAVYESNVYDIVNIENIGRQRFQKLTLKRVV